MSRIERPKIALVHPDSRGSYVCNNLIRENLGLGYLSSFLQSQGFDVEIFDARLSRSKPEIIAEDILRYDPVLVGISIIAQEGSRWSEDLAKTIKKEKVHKSPPHIVLGNYFPSLQPGKALDLVPSADSAVLGEGETTLSHLACKIAAASEWQGLCGITSRTAKGGTSVGNRRELIKDLDTLPFPTRYAGEDQILELAIEGSRGCFSRCTFCATPPHFQAEPGLRWRGRSPEKIIEEIRELRSKYPNIQAYRFVDPDFVGHGKNVQRLIDFAKGLKEFGGNFQFFIDAQSNAVLKIPNEVWRDLRGVGLKQVYLGVETGTPRAKKMMRKVSSVEDDKRAINILMDLGINTQYGFMMINPWTTEDDIESNAELIHQLDFARLDKFFQEMNLVPGTDALEIVKKSGTDIWIDGESGYYGYNLPITLENLRRTGRLLAQNHVNFLEKFYFLHKDIQERRQGIYGEVNNFKNELRDLNLSLFLAFFDQIRQISEVAPEELILEVIANVVQEFDPKISQLEQRFRSQFP